MTISDRSPARSAVANAFRPVGLMRSPMMQKDWSGPIRTSLDRELRTVCIRASFLLGWNLEVAAEPREGAVAAKISQMQAAHARK